MQQAYKGTKYFFVFPSALELLRFVLHKERRQYTPAASGSRRTRILMASRSWIIK